MINTAKLIPSEMTKSILLFAIVNFGAYVILFFMFRMVGWLHISGLRMLNYLPLGVLSCYQIKRWVKRGNGNLPFLKAFSTALITGSLSFLLFALFIFLYALADPYFANLYFNKSDDILKASPFIIIFFEGSAGSIIVGLIAMIYSEKYLGKIRR